MRRMMVPEVIIKSQVVDDKETVDLNEILEKYGAVLWDGTKTITLQIYNKFATDEPQNILSDDNAGILLGYVVINGSITITKYSDGVVNIQGMLLDNNGLYITFLEIPSQSYESILLNSPNEFDLYVIRV